MKTRRELDSLGEKEVPAEVYYGIQTQRALENFPVSGIREHPDFIRAYVMIKKAAALANMEVGFLDPRIGEPIVQACDEVLEGALLNQFVVDVFQAGAGTSFNMNVNEVLANRALEIIGRPRGDYKTIGPNDHVNMAQSTNDTFPTAMHLSTLMGLEKLFRVLENLRDAFLRKGEEFADILKSGRTHLQDALPVTLGQEFRAYASAIDRALKQLMIRREEIKEVALGGTATGTGANTHPKYRELVVRKLSEISSFDLRPASDPFEALQSHLKIAAVSSGLKELALELIRIANDLRLLSSGPTTGLAEIQLPAVQPGSSMMPGKVNPVMCECLDMIGFQIVGNDLTVSLAVQAGQLELNVMMPVIIHNVLQSIDLLVNYLPVFTTKCVEGIRANRERCTEYLEKNPSLATLLSPHIGYLAAASIAKEALERKMSVKKLVLEKGLLDKERIEEIFNPKNLLGPEGADRKHKKQA
ncbi:MAG: aspartate ammonia-lyase [Candidatus Freyarchaeota archaeon]